MFNAKGECECLCLGRGGHGFEKVCDRKLTRWNVRVGDRKKIKSVHENEKEKSRWKVFKEQTEGGEKN